MARQSNGIARSAGNGFAEDSLCQLSGYRNCAEDIAVSADHNGSSSDLCPRERFSYVVHSRKPTEQISQGMAAKGYALGSGSLWFRGGDATWSHR